MRKFSPGQKSNKRRTFPLQKKGGKDLGKDALKNTKGKKGFVQRRKVIQKKKVQKDNWSPVGQGEGVGVWGIQN